MLSVLGKGALIIHIIPAEIVVMRGERYGRGGKPSCSEGGYEFGA